MSKLRFEYNLYNIPGSSIYPLDPDAKGKFEAEINKKYESYIDKINSLNGFYNVRSVTPDGLIFSGNLAGIPIELYEEIYSHVQ